MEIYFFTNFTLTWRGPRTSGPSYIIVLSPDSSDRVISLPLVAGTHPVWLMRQCCNKALLDQLLQYYVLIPAVKAEIRCSGATEGAAGLIAAVKVSVQPALTD